MIDKLLQNRLAPVARRQQQLYLRQKLMIAWLTAALLGFVLLLYNMFGGGGITWAAFLLSGLTVAVTILFYLKARKQQPDYKAIAEYIEQHRPDLQALLLTAVEQQPLTPEKQFNYLQERVINEAIEHANQHNWIKVISNRKLEMTNWARWATGILFVFIAAQLFPPISFIASDEVASAGNVYRVSVSPGNAEIEAGSPVVIMARFEGRVPSEATLMISPARDVTDSTALSKNLDDPVYGTILPAVNQNLVYWIEFENQRSDDYQLTVYRHPELLRADARIIYPAYANLPEKTVNDTRQISVLEGSQVIFDFKLNKPVASAKLATRDGTILDLTAQAGNPENYQITFEPRESQRYELMLVDAQERANKVPPRITVNVQKNLPPELKATFPRGDLEPSPLEEITFEAEVWDDYGVTEYGLSYTVAGQETETIIFDPQAEENNKKKLNHILELEELQVEPDQLLTYYYWARDVGPDNNKRETASDLFFAEVRPFEEIFQESQSMQGDQNQQEQQEQDQNQQGEQSQRQNNEQMIELQKQIISATWNLKRQADLERESETYVEDVEAIHQSQSEVLDMAMNGIAEAQDPETAQSLQQAIRFVESALEELSQARDEDSAEPLMPALGFEQSAYQEFMKLREREFQVGRGQNSSQSSSRQSQSSTSQRTRRQLQQLELQQRENRYETERQASLNNAEQANQQENLQVQNRLSDLARRQNDVKERLQELQSELQQADEQQEEELRRELKRLQENQEQILRDMDELQQRMNESQNRQQMADANQQLSQTRENVQRATEELEQGMLSEAITSTSRAQSELERIRNEFRQQTSNQFSEQMRRMREQAQQLDQNQQGITEQIQQEIDNRQRSLTDSEELQRLTEQINQQKEILEDIINQMREVSEQSEETESLLSRRLYETFRRTNSGEINRDLEIIEELLRQNFLPQAQEIGIETGEDISQLREDIEEAAEGVLGSEAEALRLARQQLEDLIRRIEEEANQAEGVRPTEEQLDAAEQMIQDMLNRRGLSGGDPNSAGMNRDSQNRQGQNQQEQNQQGQNQQGQNQQEQNQQGQNQQGQNQQGQNQRGQNQRGQNQRGGQQINENQNRGGQRSQQRIGADRNARNPRRLLTDPAYRDRAGERTFENWGDYWPNGPILGEDYLDWTERLRDVEEMLEDPELRNEAARINELVRLVRTDVKRHGDEPQWDMVRDQIIKPMVELHQRLSEELALLVSDEAMVPIDRDPVPQRFIDLVRTYYETLGKGKDKK